MVRQAVEFDQIRSSFNTNAATTFQVMDGRNTGENRMLKILSVGAALSVLLVSSAMAQPRFPCAADIKKRCANVEPGEGRIVACIKEHIKNKDFSDVCKKRLAKAATAAKVCTEDVKKQCGSERSRVRKAACVVNALSDLSDACEDAVAAAVAPKK
jgi:Cysteine rich repeat